jgi:hypothetical protein
MRTLYDRLKPQHKKVVRGLLDLYPASTSVNVEMMKKHTHIGDVPLIRAIGIHDMIYGHKVFGFTRVYEMFKNE